MRILLRPLSWLYGAGVWIRNRLFDAGILPSVTFPIPVITVGNLVAGGSGKSPHVLLLIHELKGQYRIAVLSRGYGRKTKGFRLVTLSDTPDLSGDEPLQYLHFHPGLTVAVCEDRREGIRNLLALPEKPQVILLDDAYQHRYVKAGMTILLTEFDLPFTKDFLLPEGMLREPRREARRADFILVTKSPSVFTHDAKDVKEGISKYSQAPVEFTYMRYRDPVAMFPYFPVFQLHSSAAILLVSGIARPEPLLHYLQESSGVVEHLRYNDHHAFSESDIHQIRIKFDKFAALYPGAVIITTRKDAMRLAQPKLQSVLHKLPVYILDIEASMTDNRNNFINVIQQYVKSHS